MDNYKSSNLIERLGEMSFLSFWAWGLGLEELHFYPTCSIYSRPRVPDAPSVHGIDHAFRACPAETYILIYDIHLDTRRYFP